ncbi:MAG: LysM peptidoglycan-binding domain-containing protein [Lysobacteraceae bacterium]
MSAMPRRLAPLLALPLLVALGACAPTPTRAPTPEPASAPGEDIVQPVARAPRAAPAKARKPRKTATAAPPVETLPADGPEFLAPDLERLRARLAARLRPADCDAPATRRALAQQLRRPSQLVDKLVRVAPALDYVLGEIERQDLPGQYALIPWAESGYRADPGNRGQVQGMWQFTPGTGRHHGLRIDSRYDGRRAALQSTAAALDHLHTLQQRFIDWRLVILAYNAGEYRVLRGLRTPPPLAAASVEEMACADCALAPHSYAYLHKIVALGCLLADPARHDLALPADRFEPLALAVRPAGIHNTVRLARAAAIEQQDLLAYNAGFRNGDIADDAPTTLLLPRSAAERLRGSVGAADFALRAEQPAATGDDAHVVAPGDTLWRIARRHRVALSDLLRWNGLDAASILRPGQRLRLRPDLVQPAAMSSGTPSKKST